MTNQNEFTCSHCGLNVPADVGIGTKNRNHCPRCLFSLHVDNKVSGDRDANCSGEMAPIGITFKQEGKDKYGKEKQGEIMLIHKCIKCGRISINRIAGDDDPDQILKIYNDSKENIDLLNELKKEGVILLDNAAEAEIKRQLFGL